jgi:hypothetical protein
MTYDLALWKAGSGDTDVHAIFEAGMERLEEPVSPPDAAIVELSRSLENHWPGEGPWAGLPLDADATQDFLLVTLRHSAVDPDVLRQIAGVAAERGMIVYDLQTQGLLSGAT